MKVHDSLRYLVICFFKKISENHLKFTVDPLLLRINSRLFDKSLDIIFNQYYELNFKIPYQNIKKLKGIKYYVAYWKKVSVESFSDYIKPILGSFKNLCDSDLLLPYSGGFSLVHFNASFKLITFNLDNETINEIKILTEKIYKKYEKLYEKNN